MRHGRRIGPVVVAVVLAGLFFLWPALSAFLVDWLWFGEMAQRPVFWKLIGVKLTLGLVFGLALTALTYLNLVIARKASPRFVPRPGMQEWQQAVALFARQGLVAALLIASLVLGGLGGLVAAAKWDDWLRFQNMQPFGVTDPIFHQDVGFYVFQYPFLQFVAGWLFNTLILVTLATGAVYYLHGAVELTEGGLRVVNAVRAHLSVLLGLALLVKAWDYWLDRYGLLLTQGGILYGAGYTDLHARLPALNILMVVAVIAAVGFFVNVRLRALWLPGLALALMAVAGLTVGSLYPGLVQRFVVAPDEQAKERPYIDHHLRATRQAYGLDRMTHVEYPLGRPLNGADLQAERPTLENIRLWDYRLLGQTYQRVQGLRDYYNLRQVDIDRYTLEGQYRQVMLAPRELVTEGLPQHRWVNEKLQYTHGYGLVMSKVNEADTAGRPVWLAKDLPLATTSGLKITRPQLYYSLLSPQPVIAPSSTAEFDYQTEGGISNSSYSGPGGIQLNSTWMRLLFSSYLGDWNLFISDQVKPGSRILIRRQVQERLAHLAPFLRYDSDPYLVVLEGKLVWMQDAYTVAETYPYSEPHRYQDTTILQAGAGGLEETRLGEFNYLRNSVKISVDAYTGESRFYVMDEADPVLRVYRRAFPGLFTPRAEMPAGLAAHLRYPEDLFNLQTRKLTRFHVTDPNVFYARSDDWEIPAERTAESEGAAASQMEAYYVVMRLPGETKEEFALILPFRTRSGTTMTAWLVGRCDGDSYGQLRLYRFPSTTQVDAPDQVDNAIQTDSKISAQTTLWSQKGSVVHYGNLLVLPVGKSLLYVKPLYLEGTQQGRQGGIPELKQVILVEKRGQQLKVVMQPTLREALAELVGGEGPVPETGTAGGPERPTAPPASIDVAGLAAEAGTAFDAADRAFRAGNWAEYGRQIERARAAIQRLRDAAGGR